MAQQRYPSHTEAHIAPPVAARRPHVRHIHGTKTQDPWHWLRYLDDPAVEAYLNAENAYTEYATARLSALRSTLFAELRARISETHDSLAVLKGPWEYFTRTIAGLAYPIHLRRSHQSGATAELAEETVLLDENMLAGRHDYFAVGDFTISPDYRLLAYTSDCSGNETYKLTVVDIASGDVVDRSVDGLAYGLVWGNDSRTLFAIGMDETQRANRVLRHTVGSATSTDVEVFTENDGRFWVSIAKTRSERFVVISTESETTSECHLLDADNLAAAPRPVRLRRSGVEYRVDHQGDRLLIVTNDGSGVTDSGSTDSSDDIRGTDNSDDSRSTDNSDDSRSTDNSDDSGSTTGIATGGAENFRLMEALLLDPAADNPTAEDPDRENPDGEDPADQTANQPGNAAVGDWRELIGHRPETRLEDIDCFEKFAVLHERTNGVPHLRLLLKDDRTIRTIQLPTPIDQPSTEPSTKPSTEPSTEPPCEISAAANLEYTATSYRYEFTSMVTPPSVFEAAITEPTPPNTATDPPRLLYQSPVANGVDLSAYRSVRLWASAADGTKIPISVVWRSDATLGLPPAPRTTPEPAPCLLYGYGAYEIVMPAAFAPAHISLLDRGVVIALAHVRGGGELGRAWYRQGRLEQKQNTFDDFVTCAHHLIDAGWAQPGRMVARGGSAGGLLMGAVVNQAPELFAGIVAEVPFVDVLNTMLDPSLPLTIIEFDEWGDPANQADFQIISNYSPYENVRHIGGVNSPNVDNPPFNPPALLATAGLNDPRVGYWEPAKWIAKLRANTGIAGGTSISNDPHSADNPNHYTSTLARPILLRTEMSAGHAGPTNRYDTWRDEAFVLAFVLDALGLSR